MTSLIIFILAVAAVAVATFFLTSMKLRFVMCSYTLIGMLVLLCDYAVFTPTYNVISSNIDIEANVQYHSRWQKSIMSYVNSNKFDEFPNTRKISKAHIKAVLKELRLTTKAESLEEYKKLNCYLHETMNKYNPHGRAAVRCFGSSMNGSDNGIIKMWVNLLVTGDSQFQEKPKFAVSLKKSILENAWSEISQKWQAFREQVEAEQAELKWKANYANKCYWDNIQTTESSPAGLDSWCKYLANKKFQERNNETE